MASEESIQKLNKQKAERRRNIGSFVRYWRKKTGYNLKTVSDLMSERNEPLSTAQLSRIENGEVSLNDDQLLVLCSIFNMTEEEFRGFEKKEFWFITRKKEVVDKHLEEIKANIKNPKPNGRINDGSKSPHIQAINDHVYIYVPLKPNMNYVDDVDLEQGNTEILPPWMRKFIVEVNPVDLEQNEGTVTFPEKYLISHEGQEIMFVIQGQLYFWFRQHKSDKIENRLLKQGDCVHFSSKIEHGFSAVNGPAQALFIYSYIKLTPETVEEKFDKTKAF